MNDTAAYSLAICELFNPTLHGLTTESSPNIHGQYLVQSSFTMDEFMEDEWTDVLDMMKSQYASYPIHYKKMIILETTNTLLKVTNILN